MRTLFLSIMITCLLLANGVLAVSVSVTQSGADTDEIMKGRTFTVEAGGWTGDCSTATISFSGCSSCSLSGEETVKTIGGGSSSVTWTTVSASQSATAQKISVSLSGGCTLQQSDSSSFSIVLPPSLTVTATPAVETVAAGSSYSTNLNIVNNGETTTNDISFSVSGTGMSLSSGCSSISSLAEGQSAAQSCTITASTAGTIATTITASSTNADSASDSFSITVTGGGGDNPPGGPGSPGGPSGGVADDEDETTGEGNVTTRRARFEFGNPGIGENERLREAIMKVLNISGMSEQARANMEELSSTISSGSEFHKEMASGNGKTTMTLTYKYSGQKMIRNFMLYETVPKTIASSSDDLTVTAEGAAIEIVESDPEYLFTYPEVYPDQELNITYSVDQELDTALLDETSTEIYGESLEEFGKECEAPGERVCSEGNVYQCTEEYKLSLVQTCGYGCGNGECLPRPFTPVDLSAFLMPAVTIIIVVVIIAGLVLFKKSGKKLKRRKGVGGKIKDVPRFAPKHYK